MKAFEL